MNLQRLLLVHALITLAAGIVLIVAPAVIPSTVDIQLGTEEYLLCYFLAAAEIAIAFLSFFSGKITDYKALRLISVTFIVFHGVTGLLELSAFTQGTSGKIIGNVVLRIVICLLFYYYGIRKLKQEQ